MTNVLFICKYNRFRSKVAEAYFKNLIKEYDHEFKAKSAGIIRGQYPLDSNQIKIAKKFGIDKTGFRLIFNAGKDSGLTIEHLHLHLIGGEKLAWA